MSWTRDQAKALADRILSFSKADECEVSLRLSEDGHTRFAANDITTSGSSRTIDIGITSKRGRQERLDDRRRARRRLAQGGRRPERGPDGRRPGPTPSRSKGSARRSIPVIPGFDEATARAGPLERRDGVKAALDRARGRGLDSSGFFENGARWSAIANKKGNFGFHRSTSAEYSTTMRTSDGTGSGYAAFGAPRLADFDPATLAERAAIKAESSARPRDLPPGKYTVILEPEAVADLLGGLAFALNARSADEGRSFLSKPGGGTRLGEKLFADGVTLRSDPFDPRNPGNPWAGGGRGGGGGGGLGFGGFGGGRGRRPAGPADHLDRGRGRQDLRRRPLLGGQDQGRARCRSPAR